MAKTRSQRLNLVVKKEENKDKPELEQMLHSTNNATKSKSKITKNKKLIQALNAEVKSENVSDNKTLLASPKKKTFTRSKFTAEQIAKLIGYVVNDKMSVKAAARKVGMNHTSARRYYQTYQSDPEHKLPAPKRHLQKPSSSVTQQKIEDLIRYIVHDGMDVTQAAKKADIRHMTAAKYYAKYLKDPEQKVPLMGVRTSTLSKRCTQEEIVDLIGYIVNDKMSLVEASKKVNLTYLTAKKYYLKYLQNPNREIPDPCKFNQRRGKNCTNDQVSSLIGYIVNDGMTLFEASIKANMSTHTVSKYYQQYLDDPENNIPTPETDNIRVSINSPTVDQMKTFFCCIIIDKLSIVQAARKAKISKRSGYLYYKKYLKNPNNQPEIKDMTYSADKMKRLVELVQKEKMSMLKAAEAVDLNIKSARKYYQQYLKDPQYEFPVHYYQHYTQEDTKKLINYIECDKMSVRSAAKKIKMKPAAAYKYYKEYQNDPEHRIPVPAFHDKTKRDNFTRIIDDIYKNKPSIKPEYQIHDPKLDVPGIKIKKELVEEDTKTALKTECS